MHININNITLNYEVLGTGEPLVLIGGLTANCREWLRVDKHLAQTFTVYKPENRGAGKTSGWTHEFSIEQMADDIAVFLDVLNIDRAYVVGHSMGGAIVQRLCMMHPDRVKAAVIASSFACFPKAAQLYIENTADLLANGVSIELVLKTICTRLYGGAFLSDEKKVASEFQRMLTDPIPQTPEGYSAQVRAIRQFDARADLAKIKCPTLILNGAEDVLTPTYVSEELQRGIPHAKLRLMQQCGHMLPQENPEEFVRCILDFFEPALNQLS
jgi:pimeloyl-ACP methyl ester carboxylesterase